MATRYWVGGAGTWNATSTTNWSISSGGGSGASAPTSADDVIIDTSSGTGTITCTSASAVCNNITVTASQAITLGGTLSLINGSLSYPSGGSFSSTASLTFIATTTGKTITSNGKSVSVITFNGVGGSWQLQDALTSTSTVTLTNGTLDLNSNTLTCNAFNSSNSNTRVIAFGTGSINITGNNATVLDCSTATNFSYTGTSNMTFSYSGSTGARIIAPPGSASGGTEANTMNVNVTAGSDTINISSTRTVKNFDFTGFTGTFTLTGAAWVYGNLTLSTGMSVGASAFVLSFKATSGTQIITSNSKTINNAVTFDGIGGTFKLQDAMTVGTAYTTTLTNGALDLNNLTYTTGLFAGSNSNTRSIAFGTGTIFVTGSAATIWNTTTTTGLSISGTPNVNFTYSGSTGTRNMAHGNTTADLTAIAINFNVTAGSDIFTPSVYACKNLDFTQGTGFTGTLGNTTRVIYGNLVLKSGMTISSGASTTTFGAVSGSYTITSANLTLDFPMAFGLSGNVSTATWQLQDNLTLGSTRTCTLTYGTLDVNSKTLTTGLFSSSNSNTRVIAYGTNGNIVVNGGNWTATTATNLSYTGTGTISMTYSLAKTFSGGGSSYPILNQGGAGALSITGANTFTNITNTVQPATVTFPASTTTTVTNFGLSGTAGNLITINSSTAGTQATLSDASGTISNLNYLSIKDSNATGGATWYAGSSSTNVSNNTGWIFTSFYTSVISVTSTITNVFTKFTDKYINLTISVSNIFSSVKTIFSGLIDILGTALVTALGNLNIKSISNIFPSSAVSPKGEIIGEGWDNVPAGAETWTTITAGTETWTDITPSTDTWLRQG